MAALLAALAAIGLCLLAGVVQRRWRRLRKISQGLLVSYLTVMLLLGAGELYFRYFYADTEGRLASNNWMDRYWQVNAWGYRDREWTAADWQGKTTVAIAGDSLTAGWGINDPADRFSDVLATHLGADYAVFNLGVPGTSTPEQLDALKALPVQPNIVILQYFLNDIDYASLSQGLNLNIVDTPEIARESHLANFLYARLTAGFDAHYWQARYAAYDNLVLWDVHERELNAFADYVDSIGARLIVVIFPNLQDPVTSIAYVDRVAQVFEARGVTDILKLYDVAAAWPPEDVIVSARDAHPSIALHHYVGDTLYELFFQPSVTGD
ncbi:MAG: SGNH/GDSL hydrolase family protein [Anaerolineae bacterium]|nr:SGNH/GDSL hydrolase family protein [Anaerolineae bacterium]